MENFDSVIRATVIDELKNIEARKRKEQTSELYNRNLKNAQMSVGLENARRFAKYGMDACHISFQMTKEGNVIWHDGNVTWNT